MTSMVRHLTYGLCQNPHPDAVHIMLTHFAFLFQPTTPRTTFMLMPSQNKWWKFLSSNPSALEFLRTHPHCIYWNTIWDNPNPKVIQMAMSMARETNQAINWSKLSYNKGAIDILLQHTEHINLEQLCANQSIQASQMVRQALADGRLQLIQVITYGSKNPYLVDLLLTPENMERSRKWSEYAENPSREMVDYIIHHLQELSSYNQVDKNIVNMHLVTNPFAIDWVEQQINQLHKVEYLMEVISNPSKKTLTLLERHMATTLPTQPPIPLQQYLTSNEPIEKLFSNPHIFVNYKDKARERMVDSGLASDLMANRFHHRNIDKWRSWGMEDERDFVDMVDEDME